MGKDGFVKLSNKVSRGGFLLDVICTFMHLSHGTVMFCTEVVQGCGFEASLKRSGNDADTAILRRR